MVFQTRRLSVRKPTILDGDIDFFFKLWNNPEVMTLVGFPNGLDITRDQIRDPISKADDSEYDKKLLVRITDTGELIGECKLGTPDDGGVSMTDVKLLPEFWGCGYGTEIKQGLVDYLFTHTSCNTIRATPNQKNIASQKMQKAVGGKRVGEGIYHFPEKMQSYTIDVPYYVYEVSRADWEVVRQSPSPL